MRKFLKFLENEPCVYKLFCFLKKRQKTITNGKKTKERRTKDACRSSLVQ